MPAAVAVAFAKLPNPPLHAYVPPPVAVRLMPVVEQVSVVVPVLLVIPAVGAVVLLVMVTEAVAVQPLVTVTVTV